MTFSIYLTSYFKPTISLTVLSYSNAGHAKFNYFNLLINIKFKFGKSLGQIIMEYLKSHKK